jgi:ATP-dependent RNA helicase DeaD
VYVPISKTGYLVPFPLTSPPLARALQEKNYLEPSAVQTAVLDTAARGRDLLVSAQTGSGKTVAFGLALGETLLDEEDRLGQAAAPVALIVAPTRELALQVERELSWLYQYVGAKIVSCVGGMDPRAERRALGQGAHLVVGTPGRLRDHLERGALDVSGLKALVLDEADEMLDMGFREDLEFILETTPATRRTLLFSATLPRPIAELAKRFQNDALRIAATDTRRAHADIEYRAVRIGARDTEHAVVNLLRYYDPSGALVFCNTREAVRHLHAILTERGFSTVALSGEMSQNERNQALQSLRDGRVRICVATDVAARGIDLPSLALVIHAELPSDAEVLQHRSGRTGRAGKKGISVLLITPQKRRRAEILLAQAHIQPVWATAPSVYSILALDQERLLASAIFTHPASEDEAEMARLLLDTKPAEAVATALVRLYRQALPAPEELADPGADIVPGRERSGAHDKRKKRRETAHEEGRRARPDVPQRGGDHGAPRTVRHARSEPSKGPSGTGGSVWFRLNVGRDRNADPKWLLPEICKQGGITKRDIGQIRIFERDTRFEVNREAAEGFAARIAGREKKTGVRIDLLRGEPPQPEGSPSQRGTADKSESGRGAPYAARQPKPKERAGYGGRKGKSKSKKSPHPKKRD